MKEIKFYSHFKEYGVFSNFFEAGFFDENGLYFPTSEHYYHYHKFIRTNPEVAQKILDSSRASVAYRRSRQYKEEVDPDWDKIKVEVMRKAIYYKFTQNPDLKAKLLATKDAVLIEDSPRDYFWGIGADGSGQNMLGKLLMELRERLKNEESQVDT